LKKLVIRAAVENRIIPVHTIIPVGELVEKAGQEWVNGG
jgi:hypothetical protein